MAQDHTRRYELLDSLFELYIEWTDCEVGRDRKDVERMSHNIHEMREVIRN